MVKNHVVEISTKNRTLGSKEKFWDVEEPDLLDLLHKIFMEIKDSLNMLKGFRITSTFLIFEGGKAIKRYSTLRQIRIIILSDFSFSNRNY